VSDLIAEALEAQTVSARQSFAQFGRGVQERRHERPATFHVLQILLIPLPHTTHWRHRVRKLPGRVQVAFDFISGRSVQLTPIETGVCGECLVRALERENLVRIVRRREEPFAKRCFTGASAGAIDQIPHRRATNVWRRRDLEILDRRGI
jgi:hypothetical protein